MDVGGQITTMAIARHVSSGWKLMNYACLNNCMVMVLMEGQLPDVLLLYMGIWYRWPCSAGDIATNNHNTKS